MTRPFALATVTLLALAVGTGKASVASAAADNGIALSEVTPPPPSSGVDQATLKRAAEGEIRQLDGSRVKRRVLVSVALVRADDKPVSFIVNATLREERTGNVFAIVEGRARAEGAASNDLMREVAHAAVRSAVRQIPGAL